MRVPGAGRLSPWQLTGELVDQIWAEAVTIADAGESLYLAGEVEDIAREEQKTAMEQDDREGLVLRYLDTLLPENWAGMDTFARQEYIADPDAPTQPEGTRPRIEVSNIEIWCECFGKRKEDIKPQDSYQIAAIMARIGGWERVPDRKYIPIYGRQRVYGRE